MLAYSWSCYWICYNFSSFITSYLCNFWYKKTE